MGAIWTLQFTHVRGRVTGGPWAEGRGCAGGADGVGGGGGVDGAEGVAGGGVTFVPHCVQNALPGVRGFPQLEQT